MGVIANDFFKVRNAEDFRFNRPGLAYDLEEPFDYNGAGSALGVGED